MSVAAGAASVAAYPAAKRFSLKGDGCPTFTAASAVKVGSNAARLYGLSQLFLLLFVTRK